MKLPTPDETRELARVLNPWKEALDYCAATAIDNNDPDSIWYDAKEDQVVYHLVIQEMDSSIVELLRGADEIWIITGAGTES